MKVRQKVFYKYVFQRIEPTTWLWTFEGGTPLTSTLQNPIVTYSSAGTYKVTLKVSNSIGNNTLTKNSYIQVIQSFLSVSPNSLIIEAIANSTKTFNITSNTNWTVSSSETWLKVNRASGSGNATITLTVQINTIPVIRTAIVTVSGTGVVAQTVTVTLTNSPSAPSANQATTILQTSFFCKLEQFSNSNRLSAGCCH